MKKVPLLMLVCLSTLSAFAQPRSGGSFNIGPIVTARSTWILNKNVSDAQETEQAYVPSFGFGYGINLGSYFSDNFGIELDIFMSSHNQKYKGGATYGLQYHSVTKLKMVDIPLVMLIKSNSGSYFELGAMYSLVNKADYEWNLDSSATSGGTDVKDRFQKNNFAAVVGFGMEGNLSDQLLIAVGFRFTYGLSDLKGVDGRGIAYDNSVVYTDPYKTHSATGGIHVGLKYMLEY